MNSCRLTVKGDGKVNYLRASMRDLQSFIQVFPFIVAASLAIILAWRTWRSDDPGGKTGSVILIAITIWSLSEALEVVSPTLSSKILWDKISFFGIVIIPNAWLVYVFQNFWKDRQPAVRFLVLLLLMPMARALRVPISTTRRRPLVTAV